VSRQQGKRLFHKFGYRLITSFVILWLGIFYPALCEYHGLLLFRAPTPQAGAGHDHVPVQHDPYRHMTSTAHRQEQRKEKLTTAGVQLQEALGAGLSPSPLVRHKRAPVESSLMSVFSLALPSSATVLFFLSESSQISAELKLTHQADLSPPDQPPRLCLL
jgi:hypothetical protein